VGGIGDRLDDQGRKVVLAPGYPSRFSVEVLEMVARSAPEAVGPFFMVRKADGAVVGEIGAGLDGATARVGYTVVEPSWGQGYATEALRALLAHLLADPGCTGWWPRPSSGTRPAAG
jgi:RimJ/RimL family protein N-acetyltransferase